MLRLSFHRHTETHRKLPHGKKIPLLAVGAPVGRSACGYRLEAASRRAGLGSTLGCDGSQRHSGSAAPR